MGDILCLGFAATVILTNIAADVLSWWLGWLRPILYAIAWALDNIGGWILAYSYWKYKSLIYWKYSYMTYLYLLALWLAIDFIDEWALDYYNIFRDY